MIDVGSPVDIIYLDFQKAFDKVPHQRLLLKLKAHGIRDSITDWIEQWLTDRRQRVVVDGEVSNWKSVLSGVPQGSVLGPILFLIYINDLNDSITSNGLKFADDTKLFRKVNTDGDKQRLQNECGLTTLETRRLRDQIEVFKILNGYENIDRNMFFSLKKDSRTRGHEVKLVKDQCRLDIRKHSFSQRTINEWNKLSTDCVTASSMNMFKNKVDTYLRRAGYK